MPATDPKDMPLQHPLNGQGAVRMPLGARRLLFIGGFCVPVGLIATAYVFGAQLLLVAGVAAVAVALSYRDGEQWFSKWSWLTAIAGGAWVLFTAGYWLTIISAAQASTPLTIWPTVLFSCGIGAVVGLVAGLAGGCVSRFLTARRAQALSI